MDNFFKSGGCKEKWVHCQVLAEDEDPDWTGNVPSVIDCFQSLEGTCSGIMEAATNITVSALVTKAGRRELTISSGAGMTLPTQEQIPAPNHVSISKCLQVVHHANNNEICTAI